MGLGCRGGGGRSRSGLGARFRTFDTVFRSADPAFFNPGGIQPAADNVIAHTRQIFHTSTTHKHNRVLLQIMSHTRNISRYFLAVG